MPVDDYRDREITRLSRELERVRDDVRNPQPPMVPLALFEEVRTTQGKRIGDLEELVRNIQGKVWTALIFPVVVVLAGAVLLSVFGIHT